MPLRKLNTLGSQLFLGKKSFSSLIVLLSEILYVEGVVFLYTQLMAPAALFPSENICILLMPFVTLENSFDERRKKADRLEKVPNFCAPLRQKSGMKIFIVNFFINYLLICNKLSFIWGSILGRYPLCSL